jgi:PleD family two-component response regulator
MVLCAVDDLMFASRIRSAAARSGTEVRFVRGAAALLDAARTGRASLLLLDLNADALDPLGLVAALRADPALAGVRTVGFVSHVQGDRVAAARAAGVDDVLARSAFVTQLPALLEHA